MRSVDQSASRRVLGYALAFANDGMGVRLYGSPREILDSLRQRNLDFGVVADHPDTSIDCERILAESPRLSFKGGPRAEATLELIEAVLGASRAGARAVLQRRPDVVSSDHSGAALPLLAAASTGDPEMMALLLGAGSTVDAPGEFGMTALHWAAAQGAAAAVTALIDAGADGRRQSWFYVNPAEVASLNDHAEAARIIERRCDVSVAGFSVHEVLRRMRRLAARSA